MIQSEYLIFFVREAVESGALGFIEEIVFIDLICYQVGFDLSLTVVLLAFLHHFKKFSFILSLIVLKLLADEKERNVKDSA